MALLMIGSPFAPPPIKISLQHQPLRLLPTKIPNLQHRSASSGNRFSPPRCTLSPEPVPAPASVNEGVIGLSVADRYGITIATDTHNTEPVPAPASVNEGVIGLSVADRYGVTVATDTRNPAAKWRTIGENLIAYGDGDGAYLKFYFDQLLHKFRDDQFVSFQSLMAFNKYGMPSRQWTHHGSLTIDVRDRFYTASIPGNLLRVEISKDHIKQEVTTESLAAIGTGARFARDKLKSVWSMIDCHHFGASENTRRFVLSMATLKAMRSDDTNSGLFSEIIRGTPFEEWKLVSTTPIDELLIRYGALRPETHVPNYPLPPPPNVDDSFEAENIERLRMILKPLENCSCKIDSLKVFRMAN